MALTCSIFSHMPSTIPPSLSSLGSAISESISYIPADLSLLPQGTLRSPWGISNSTVLLFHPHNPFFIVLFVMYGVLGLLLKVLSFELQIDIEVVKRDTCQEEYENLGNSGITFDISEAMICAWDPEGGKDFCTVRFARSISEQINY